MASEPAAVQPPAAKAHDGNTSFLRAARSGNLDKVLEHLKNHVDINTSNTNGLNALHLGAKDGHVPVVAELLRRGAIVDNATKKGNTALHIASLAGQEDVVKLLLQHKAAVNAQSQNGFTPLYMASQENHDSVVRLLLANGANQSLATEDGFTPLAVAMQQGHDKVVAILLESDTRGKVRLPALHIAAKKDDVKAAALLLENDHNPDVTSKSGFTPLHIASHYGNESIANLLIANGADVNFAAKHNISPLHVTAKWGKTNMVALLLEKGATIDSKTRDGLTPLHCAARSGHEQVVDMLLERGAPISAKTKNGLAPLHMAAQGEHVDAARILLYHRAPVDEVTVDYLTALHVAAHCGHVRVAKLLLDRNADANARALNGFTPLHIACKKNRIKVVELLLKHGASISATTESGLTPLHVASFMGCMNIVIYLLQHEASPDVPTVRGETPLHLAARANQTDIIRILLRNGAQVDARAREQQTPLHIASRLGNVDIVMLLLQHGAQVDATTKDMYTALHIAAKEGQDEVIGALIENNASLDATTKKGLTPLHIAAKYGHRRVTELLLQRGAAVDAQGKNGVTPLHVAAHYDHQAVALLLLAAGASPHAQAKNGHTPLHIAARKNQMDIASALLEYKAAADAESKAGFTPLHLAAQEGHLGMAELLLEHRAAPDQAARNGLRPMHLCAQEDRTQVAELLCKHGASTEVVTRAGFTPLHVAAHFGQANMVRFLLRQQQGRKDRPEEGGGVNATTAIGYTALHHAAQQGQSHVCQVLLENEADPSALTENGQTAVQIAQRLGYISVIETLRTASDPMAKDSLMQTSLTGAEAADKYCVVAPEQMHEFFMSDSEEEGDENTTDQPYRYLTVDEMRSLGDDSLPIDVTRDERVDSNRMAASTESAAAILPPQAIEDAISPQHGLVFGAQPAGQAADATDAGPGQGQYVIDHTKFDAAQKNYGFLVSFLVDARGGAMRGCRHSGIRIIVPHRSAAQPTRITCRYVKPQRNLHPPQLMEGEALASRVLELGPVGVKFIGPVVIEVPHFASLRAKEREILVLRSDNGETWREHSVDQSEEILQDILTNCFESDEYGQSDELLGGRICRFVTYDFPQYFAVVSRIRQETHAIGPEGGMVSSTVVPQVQAVFPQGALTKKIKVGLQAQPIDPNLTAKLLGRGVAVSPIVTVEPRRRKFHKAITLSMPAPKAHSQGMINQYSGNAPTLRLLCSITGGPSRAQWEDVTGSTPLTFVNDCVSFTTTVSARFWLMDCRNIADATKMATDLYREAIYVPFMAKLVVFAKRIEPLEARLRVFCMTDDREDKTLEAQQHFTQVAKSRDVEVIEGKTQYIELAGNLVPVTKSGEQLHFAFKAFRENRLPFSVRVKDQHADIVGRALFMREPRVAKGEQPQQPICILNIVLPEQTEDGAELKVTIRQPWSSYAPPPSTTAAAAAATATATTTTSVSPSQIASDNKYKTGSTESLYFLHDLRIADIANTLGEDWLRLAPHLEVTSDEIDGICAAHPMSHERRAQAMLRLFQSREPDEQRCLARLEKGLASIQRSNILRVLKSPVKSSSVQSREDELVKDMAAGKNGRSRDEAVEQILRKEKIDHLRQSHDFDELKYSAEEKTIVAEEQAPGEEEEEEEEADTEEDDDESVKKTVADRRAQISKRLSVERQIPASSQKKEIKQEICEIKRHSFIEDKRALHEEEISAHAASTSVPVIKPSAKEAEAALNFIAARKEDSVSSGSGGSVSISSTIDRELESKLSNRRDEHDSAIGADVELEKDSQNESCKDAAREMEPEEEVHITSVETLVKMHEQSQIVHESSERSHLTTAKVVLTGTDGIETLRTETVHRDTESQQKTDKETVVHEQVLSKTDDQSKLAETTMRSAQKEQISECTKQLTERELRPIDLDSGIPAASTFATHDLASDASHEVIRREKTAEAEQDTDESRAHVKFAEETKAEYNVLETEVQADLAAEMEDTFCVESTTTRTKRNVDSDLLEEAFHKESTISYKETEKESTFLDVSDVESERGDVDSTAVNLQKDAGIFSEEHSITDEVETKVDDKIKQLADDKDKLVLTTGISNESTDEPNVSLNQLQSFESESTTTSLITEKRIMSTGGSLDRHDLSPERDADTDELRSGSDVRKQSGSSSRGERGGAGESDWDLSQTKPTPEQLQTPDETAITDINIDSGISVKVTEEMKSDRYGEILEEPFIAEPASHEKSEKDNTFSMSSMESDPEISIQCADQNTDAALDDEDDDRDEQQIEAQIQAQIQMSDAAYPVDIEHSVVSSSFSETIGSTEVQLPDTWTEDVEEIITTTTTTGLEQQSAAIPDGLAYHAPEQEDLHQHVRRDSQEPIGQPTARTVVHSEQTTTITTTKSAVGPKDDFETIEADVSASSEITTQKVTTTMERTVKHTELPPVILTETIIHVSEPLGNLTEAFLGSKDPPLAATTTRTVHEESTTHPGDDDEDVDEESEHSGRATTKVITITERTTTSHTQLPAELAEAAANATIVDIMPGGDDDFVLHSTTVETDRQLVTKTTTTTVTTTVDPARPEELMAAIDRPQSQVSNIERQLSVESTTTSETDGGRHLEAEPSSFISEPESVSQSLGLEEPEAVAAVVTTSSTEKVVLFAEVGAQQMAPMTWATATTTTATTVTTEATATTECTDDDEPASSEATAHGVDMEFDQSTTETKQQQETALSEKASFGLESIHPEPEFHSTQTHVQPKPSPRLSTTATTTIATTTSTSDDHVSSAVTSIETTTTTTTKIDSIPTAIVPEHDHYYHSERDQQANDDDATDSHQEAEDTEDSNDRFETKPEVLANEPQTVGQVQEPVVVPVPKPRTIHSSAAAVTPVTTPVTSATGTSPKHHETIFTRTASASPELMRASQHSSETFVHELRVEFSDGSGSGSDPKQPLSAAAGVAAVVADVEKEPATIDECLSIVSDHEVMQDEIVASDSHQDLQEMDDFQLQEEFEQRDQRVELVEHSEHEEEQFEDEEEQVDDIADVQSEEDEDDDQKYLQVDRKTSFYIGESTEDIIKKTYSDESPGSKDVQLDSPVDVESVQKEVDSHDHSDEMVGDLKDLSQEIDMALEQQSEQLSHVSKLDLKLDIVDSLHSDDDWSEKPSTQAVPSVINEPELAKTDFLGKKVEHVTDTESMLVSKAFEEVEESLKAVHDGLVEVAKSGASIEESPSEFSIKMLSDIRFPHMEAHSEEAQQDETEQIVKGNERVVIEQTLEEIEEFKKALMTSQDDFSRRVHEVFVVDYMQAVKEAQSAIDEQSRVRSQRPGELVESMETDHKVLAENLKTGHSVTDQPQLDTERMIMKTTEQVTEKQSLLVTQAFEEVEESLQAVNDELVDNAQDELPIKESPSEYSLKLLPDIKFPQLEAHHEESAQLHTLTDQLTETCIELETTGIVGEQSASSTAAAAAFAVESVIDSENQEELISTTTSAAAATTDSDEVASPSAPNFVTSLPTNRWSASEPEYYSSSASQYESMERTETTGPNSSSIDVQMSGFSEYQTANEPSFVTAVDSSEYQTANASLDPSSSACSSLPSFNSESSANLGSIDISDASETLMPEEVVSDEEDYMVEEEDDDEEDVEGEHSEMEIANVVAHEHSDDGVLSLQQDLEALRQSPSMKRSQEMHFDKIVTESSVVQEDIVDKSIEETVTAAHDIVSEVLEDKAHKENVTTEHDESWTSAQVSSTSTIISTATTTTAISTTTTSTTSEECSSEAPAKRSKGHKRSDSTVFLKNLEAMKQIEDEVTSNIADEVADFPSSGSVSEDLQARFGSGSASGAGAAGSESDSDNDRYETEYTRSFRQPTQASFKKTKKTIEIIDTQLLERKKSVPSIETIAEDIVAEVESELFLKGVVSQNVPDYSAATIPDITVSEEPDSEQVYDLEQHEHQFDIDNEIIYHSDVASETEEPESKPDQVSYTSQSTTTKTSTTDTFVPNQAAQPEPELPSSRYEEPAKPDSPTSDSFEMLEQPDIADEFVIIEEVAKEANEFDSEGKSITIQMAGKNQQLKHDTEVEAILVRSAPAATNEGSIVFQGQGHLDFDFDDHGQLIGHESSGTSTHRGSSDEDDNGGGLDSSRKWVEMQLAEQAQNLRYPYDLERGILEDIKEEDTDLEVGSSRLSSFKDSFSSPTPDYEILARQRRYAEYAAAAVAGSNGKEHDNMSVNSLQEFENLEQAISLENRRFQHGSQDSSSGSGSLSRRYQQRGSGAGATGDRTSGSGGANGDDFSGSSLKEFEGLEDACVEAQRIEIKAREEAALLLSRSDESDASPSNREPICVRRTAYETTVTSSVTTTTVVTAGDGREATVVVDQFETRPLDTSDSHLCGSTDSLELSRPAKDPLQRSVDSIDMALQHGDGRSESKSNSDSLEQLNQLERAQLDRHDSVDSIDAASRLTGSGAGCHAASGTSGTSTTAAGTASSVGGPPSSATSSYSPCSLTGDRDRDREDVMSKEMSCDSLFEGTGTTGSGTGTGSEALLTSVESLDRSSSTTTTNATWQNVGDSQMSDSTTSCCSNTMIDTLERQFEAAETASSLGGASSSSTSGASTVVHVTQQLVSGGAVLTTTTTTTSKLGSGDYGPRTTDGSDGRPADF